MKVLLAVDGSDYTQRMLSDSDVDTGPIGLRKVLAFIAAALLATGILVAAGLGDDDPGPQVGWFDVSA